MTRSFESRGNAQHPDRVGGAQRQRPLALGLVDTVPLFRDGISALVDRTPWMRFAGHAASQQGAIHMTEQVNPDIVLVDSGLDGGCHLSHLLAKTSSSARVVVLIRESDRTSSYLAAVMAAGAHGATPRCAEPQRVLDAIRHATHARRYLDPSLANLVTQSRTDDHLDEQSNGSAHTPDPNLLRLSRRELQVLQLIAEGLENAAIAKVLFLSVETVRTHVKSILRKLSARDRTHSVTIAFRNGLLSLNSPEAELPSQAGSADGTADTDGTRGSPSRPALAVSGVRAPTPAHPAS
ncbi:DNA-binding response regulator, NarL/FixJ family, contains REC and HTH domains [Haloechinothrix alba]|uniref:DNA-binding response regulator, NarL/FixJ family, contains REC and HTH domains n=1 Tax=Haloechinothrix alba TaxID=664784 RepID=A0A238Y795_9PSEU|nr:response regulator transcription factor [Haloechinothrix alba]SNR66822.1 DNA-binding response regulator, NarL/FixJ family, contains REC and HTH domains [Haloechinothrix alba]